MNKFGKQQLNKNFLSAALCTSVFVTCTLMSTSAKLQAQTSPPDSVTAADFIDIFEKLSGAHPGFRKAHAKGVCATGTFTPNKDAKYFKGANLLASDTLQSTIRFSLGGGNPSSDERVPGVRGMATQIKLPDGSRHTFAGNSSPNFAGKDPETFFGLLQTFLPDESGKPNMAKTGAYIAANPSTQANAFWSQTTPAPASFANTPYFGLHTFFYQANDNKEKVKFRWNIVPKLGNVGLSKEDAAALPAEFLENKLIEQVQNDDIDVSFTLEVAIGQDTDTNVDPSVSWPTEREKVELGTINILKVGGKACDPLNFDPNILSSGFSSSDDPVLRMRSPAYGISMGKRLSNQ
jgi:catalase